MPFLDGLFVSSLPRAYLENMQSGRSRGGVSKILPTGEIEARLDKIVRIHGDEKLNELRDNARETAGELGMEKEFQALDKLIGALLRARPDHELVTPLAAVRAAGSPYDPDRLNLFQELFSALKGTELHVREEIEYTPEAFRNMAFFEAYFSNYIEGTAFELEETQEIVWQGKIPSNRPADAHDILGTYKIVANTQEMSRVPEKESDLAQLLESRHTTLMEGHPEMSPGSFKEQRNRAGQTFFVVPELVPGTLRKGYGFYQALENPLARAMFMMFLVAEVHPFADGNGRIARIMMNAELVHAGLRRILIPAVYREDYLLALRAVSRQKHTEPYIKMMDRAQRFSAKIDFSSYKAACDMLTKSDAFKEPNEGRLKDNL